MLDHLRNTAEHPTSRSQFLAVMEKTVRCLDQMLGYRGKDRFVIYYYEPRGEEVVWRDSRSYGFATGAWSTFIDEVAPVAEHYKVDVGCSGVEGRHVLMIDRRDRRAYFAIKAEAVKFLAAVAAGEEGNVPGSKTHFVAKVPAAMLEITHEAIAILARDLWERRGRPAGQDVPLWLEAEARLKSGSKDLEPSEVKQ
jgi:hypothetical protein